MSDQTALQTQVQSILGARLLASSLEHAALTITIQSEHLLETCWLLRDNPALHFEVLIDLCGVDYLHYGLCEWATEDTTLSGFSRGVQDLGAPAPEENTVHAGLRAKRFAVVYHLLSIKHNQRIRLKTFALGEPPRVPSVTPVWQVANWYEREAFDLFGILFDNHPDLRRILTDYGFVGHPFRKDFPISGHVEVHYSETERRVLYAPVTIKPRTLVPKTIRTDNRYEGIQPELKVHD